jgi:hypothetical protein
MIFRRSDNVGMQVVDGRAFLLDEGGAEMIVLNPVGTMVWDALDGASDASTIAESLASSFEDVPLARLESDVCDFLEELAGIALVVAVK